MYNVVKKDLVILGITTDFPLRITHHSLYIFYIVERTSFGLQVFYKTLFFPSVYGLCTSHLCDTSPENKLYLSSDSFLCVDLFSLTKPVI